ncbi:MAG: kinase [Bacilli bacterium]|nr:kinase [Bacilli bacterium]
MIITKTPFRMSFFGGGTDIPEYFNKNGGAVISVTFNKYVYVTVRHLPRFFDYTTELTYSKLERVTIIDNLQHPMVKNAMKYLHMHELHISYDADLPARSGLGTSSSFAVGLLNAFYCLKSKIVSKKQLADDAIYVERVMCNEAGGWQDQIAVSFGGFNRIDFDKNGYSISPIKIKKERKDELEQNLLLFFTGFTRLSADIQKTTTREMKDKSDILSRMQKLVDKAQRILEDDGICIDEFGMLLDETWKLKREVSSSISSSNIDSIYKKGIGAGALGGKLLGAGGGGFILFYVPRDKQNDVRKALGLMEVPFEFENEGTKVIYYAPEFYDNSDSVEK